MNPDLRARFLLELFQELVRAIVFNGHWQQGSQLTFSLSGSEIGAEKHTE